MRDRDRREEHHGAENGVPPGPATQNARKPKKREKNQTTSYDRRKEPRRRGWRSGNFLRKAEIIGVLVAALGGFGYFIAYIIVSARQSSVAEMEDRPRVIISRPPELLGAVQCYVTDKAIHYSTGAMRLWVKNIGRGDAVNAFVFADLKLVPDQKTGAPIIDNAPSITDQTCRTKLSPSSKMFPVYAGQDVYVDVRQSVAVQSLVKTNSVSVGLGAPQPEPKASPDQGLSKPIKIAKNAPFQLYAALCVYYSDRNGVQYASCRTYRLDMGSLMEGPYSFSCTQTPVRGSFEATLGNYCDN